jgi:hypothetical protein
MEMLALDYKHVKTCSETFLDAYDDLYSIEYFHQRLRPYWRRNGAQAADLLATAERDPGQELFSPSAADYFLTLIDGAQSWVENLATRPDADRFEKILRLFRDARAELHRRLHQQGIEH